MTWTTGARTERLPNGLTLVAQSDPAAPAVAVVTHVRAGFFDEPDEWQGISHVLEHMFFKGTPRRAVGRIAQETKALGGYLNASTSYDRTMYYVVLPARNLEGALDIQSDALRHPTLDGGELARELQVIIEEAKRKLDSPGAVTGETLHELRFDRHRIRRWRIGHAEQLARFTAADVRGYYASRYTPDRIVVALVGALPADELIARARPYYEGWKVAASPLLAGPAEGPSTGIRARTLHGDVTQAELVLGWRGVPALHDDEAALDLASAILGAGRGSWLHRALREPGLAASVGAYSFATDEVGVIGAAASGAPDRVAGMVRGIADETRRLRDAGPTIEELTRARTLLRVRWVRRMESFEARATALAWATAHGDVALIDREYERMLAVTPTEVRDAARRHMTPETVAAVEYQPHDRPATLSTEFLAETFARPAPPVRTASLPGTNGRVTHPGGRGGADRVVAGTHHFVRPGADILVHRKAGIPTTTLHLHLPRAWEQAATAGLGALAVRTAVRGAGDLDAAALALAMERLGGSLSPSASTDALALGTTVLTEHLAEAAALLQRVVSDPRLAPDDLLAEQQVLLEEARESADDMFRFPFQSAFRAAFGDSGYGLPPGGLESSIPFLTRDAVVAQWRDAGAGRATIVVVGDAEPARLAGWVEEGLSELVGRVVAPVNGDARVTSWHAAGALPTVQTRRKQQTAFAMLFPGPARNAADHTAAEVWAAIASGLGGRLFEALREKRSLAYTVLGTAWARRCAGALGVYIATSPAREEEARAEMLKELAKFATELAGAEELERAKEYLAGQSEISRMTAGAVAGEIGEVWMQGAGLEELEAPWERYRSVTAEEVLAVAKASFDPGSRAEGVVRGSAASAGA